MTLTTLIRKQESAEATVAAPATRKFSQAVTVANVASVDVANQLLIEEETAIRKWQAHIEDADWRRCRSLELSPDRQDDNRL